MILHEKSYKESNMRKLKVMAQEDAELVIQISYLLAELNKKYGFPHGKNPTGIILHALKRFKEKKKREISF